MGGGLADCAAERSPHGQGRGEGVLRRVEPQHAHLKLGAYDKHRVSRKLRADGADLRVECVRLPYADDGVRRGNEPGRWVKRESQSACPLGRHPGKACRREWHLVRRVIGRMPQPLQPRNIGEIGQPARRLEILKEGRKALAIFDQNRRAGRMSGGKKPRRRYEKILANKALDHGIKGAQGIDEAGVKIVAVDAEALGADQPRRRLAGFEHGARKLGLDLPKALASRVSGMRHGPALLARRPAPPPAHPPP